MERIASSRSDMTSGWAAVRAAVFDLAFDWPRACSAKCQDAIATPISARNANGPIALGHVALVRAMTSVSPNTNPKRQRGRITALSYRGPSTGEINALPRWRLGLVWGAPLAIHCRDENPN